MTLRTKGSPCNTAIRNHLSRKNSSGKVMLTIFWNSERVVLADFLEIETTINSQRYIETLTALKNRTDWNKKWNTSSTRQSQASHKFSNKRCNSTPELFTAAASTVWPRSGSKWFPPVPKTQGTLEGSALQLWRRGEVCSEEMVSKTKHHFLRMDLKN